MYTKRITISLLAVLMASSALWSQTVVPVDFHQLNNGNLKQWFDNKQKVRVKVININRFLYKVSAEKTETDFFMTVPAVMGGIKLPAAINFGTPGPEGAPSPAKIADSLKNAGQWKAVFEDSIKSLIKIQERLNEFIEMHNKVVDESKNCKDSTSVIISNVIKIIASYKIGSKDSTIPALADSVMKEITKNLKNADTIAKNIEERYDKWRSVDLIEYRKSQNEKKENLVTFKEQLAELQASLKTSRRSRQEALKKEIKGIELNIRQAETQVEQDKEDQEAEVNKMSAILEKAKTLIADIQKFSTEGKAYTLVEDLKKVNESSFTYYSEIVEMKKDEVKLAITATAETPLPCDQPMEQKFTVKLRTKTGVKLDFSTGLFFNFGSDKFHGDEYYYKPINDDQATIEMKDAGSRVGLSIGGLLHIYCRKKNTVKWGGVAGISTTFNLDALNFHLGGSMLIGDEERFCVSAGLTLREAKMLDRNYTAGTVYDKKLLPESVPLITKFPVTGAFLSLTYNLTRFNKE